MQIIKEISISNGQPVIYMPLAVILSITAIKDLFEDMKRHKSDNEENGRKVWVLRDGQLMETIWADIKIGEIIKVRLYLVFLLFFLKKRSMKMSFFLQISCF